MTLSRSLSTLAGRAATSLLATLALAGAAAAQGFPERPLKLVVPFPAGGGSDLAARVFTERFAAVLGQPVVIDNKPGASGNIGAEAVARAPADGYTLLFGNEFLATNPALFKDLRYDTLRDFTPVAKVASSAVAIAAHPSLPARDMKELVALAKTRELTYSSPGVGTGPHLFGQLLALNAGARLKNIPYRGSAPATADAVGGQVDFIISTLTPMVPYFSSGKLRGLAVTSGKRSPQAADIPTLRESGLDAQDYEVWYGVLAPSGVPPRVLATLREAAAEAMRDPQVQARLRKAGYEVEPVSAQVFGSEIQADLERWARVARDAKITRE